MKTIMASQPPIDPKLDDINSSTDESQDEYDEDSKVGKDEDNSDKDSNDELPDDDKNGEDKSNDNSIDENNECDSNDGKIEENSNNTDGSANDDSSDDEKSHEVPSINLNSSTNISDGKATTANDTPTSKNTKELETIEKKTTSKPKLQASDKHNEDDGKTNKVPKAVVEDDASTEDQKLKEAKKKKEVKKNLKKETIKKNKKKVPKNTSDEDLMDEFNIQPLDQDDSFMNPPESIKKQGKHNVKNFQKRRPKDFHPDQDEEKNVSKGFSVTSLNNQISFIAIGETAKTQHDEKMYGIKPCGLYPSCSNIFRGGEDIGLVKIISPDHHVNHGKQAWACWYHCDASCKGLEIQIQEKVEVKETPKNQKTAKKTSELTGAPVKKAPNLPKELVDTEANPDAKTKLEDRLAADDI